MTGKSDDAVFLKKKNQRTFALMIWWAEHGDSRTERHVLIARRSVSYIAKPASCLSQATPEPHIERAAISRIVAGLRS